LIVDDDPAVRQLLATILGFEGWEVSSAGDGETALDAAASTHPDVVLVDVSMPGISGYEVCRRLKESSSPPRVIMVTGRASSGEAGKATGAGADGYLTKPFSPAELLDVVAASLGHRS
jgi:DNA-binding response OmpR family regulator